jgi:hypothetical protein
MFFSVVGSFLSISDPVSHRYLFCLEVRLWEIYDIVFDHFVAELCTIVLTLSCRTSLHSASSNWLICCGIAVFVFKKPLFINKLYRVYVCYTNIMLYIAFGIIHGFT